MKECDVPRATHMSPASHHGQVCCDLEYRTHIDMEGGVRTLWKMRSFDDCNKGRTMCWSWRGSPLLAGFVEWDRCRLKSYTDQWTNWGQAGTGSRFLLPGDHAHHTP